MESTNLSASRAGSILPGMRAGFAASHTFTVDPVMRAGFAAERAFAVSPLMSAGFAANGTNTARILFMLTGNSADRTGVFSVPFVNAPP